jgi:serine protease Do
MRTARRVVVVLAAFALVAAAAGAQREIDASRRNAIVRAIEKASPAVVSINVIEVRTRGLSPLFNDFWEFFGPPPGRQIQRRVDSVGSGFIIDNRGHIITNAHVLEGASDIASVTLPDGQQIPAELVGIDERTDVAVIRAESNGLPSVAFGDSESLVTGEWAIAIGNPFGGLLEDTQPTVSVGVISATRRRINRNVTQGERLYQDMIQTDAAINPGNSGGPLVNANGEVIGVNTMIFSRSGGNVGIGFAIPIDRARKVAEEIIEHGRRRDPWAGFRVVDIASQQPYVLQELGITAEYGCVVTEILQDAPAYRAGLRPRDVITRINGRRVMTSSDIDFELWGSFIDDVVTLEVDRRSETQTIKFVLKELR